MISSSNNKIKTTGPNLVTNNRRNHLGNAISYEGFIHKQGGANGGTKNWKTRYFTISGDTLQYSKDKSTSGLILGTISLSNCIILDLSKSNDDQTSIPHSLGGYRKTTGGAGGGGGGGAASKLNECKYCKDLPNNTWLNVPLLGRRNKVIRCDLCDHPFCGRCLQNKRIEKIGGLTLCTICTSEHRFTEALQSLQEKLLKARSRGEVIDKKTLKRSLLAHIRKTLHGDSNKVIISDTLVGGQASSSSRSPTIDGVRNSASGLTVDEDNDHSSISGNAIPMTTTTNAGGVTPPLAAKIDFLSLLSPDQEQSSTAAPAVGGALASGTGVKPPPPPPPPTAGRPLPPLPPRAVSNNPDQQQQNNSSSSLVNSPMSKKTPPPFDRALLTSPSPANDAQRTDPTSKSREMSLQSSSAQQKAGTSSTPGEKGEKVDSFNKKLIKEKAKSKQSAAAQASYESTLRFEMNPLFTINLGKRSQGLAISDNTFISPEEEEAEDLVREEAGLMDQQQQYSPLHAALGPVGHQQPSSYGTDIHGQSSSSPHPGHSSSHSPSPPPPLPRALTTNVTSTPEFAAAVSPTSHGSSTMVQRPTSSRVPPVSPSAMPSSSTALLPLPSPTDAAGVSDTRGHYQQTPSVNSNGSSIPPPPPSSGVSSDMLSTSQSTQTSQVPQIPYKVPPPPQTKPDGTSTALQPSNVSVRSPPPPPPKRVVPGAVPQPQPQPQPQPHPEGGDPSITSSSSPNSVLTSLSMHTPTPQGKTAANGLGGGLRDTFSTRTSAGTLQTSTSNLSDDSLFNSIRMQRRHAQQIPIFHRKQLSKQEALQRQLDLENTNVQPQTREFTLTFNVPQQFRPNCFCVKTQDRELWLNCDTQEQKVGWMRKISKVAKEYARPGQANHLPDGIDVGSILVSYGVSHPKDHVKGIVTGDKHYDESDDDDDEYDDDDDDGDVRARLLQLNRKNLIELIHNSHARFQSAATSEDARQEAKRSIIKLQQQLKNEGIHPHDYDMVDLTLTADPQDLVGTHKSYGDSLRRQSTSTHSSSTVPPPPPLEVSIEEEPLGYGQDDEDDGDHMYFGYTHSQKHSSFVGSPHDETGTSLAVSPSTTRPNRIKRASVVLRTDVGNEHVLLCQHDEQVVIAPEEPISPKQQLDAPEYLDKSLIGGYTNSLSQLRPWSITPPEQPPEDAPLRAHVEYYLFTEAQKFKLRASIGHPQSPDHHNQFSINIMNAFPKMLDPSSVTLLSRVGGGAYGDVYKGLLRSTGVAIKTLKRSKDREALQDLCREIAILSTVNHPNVVLYCGVSLSDEMIPFEATKELEDLYISTEEQTFQLNQQIEQLDNDFYEIQRQLQQFKTAPAYIQYQHQLSQGAISPAVANPNGELIARQVDDLEHHAVRVSCQIEELHKVVRDNDNRLRSTLSSRLQERHHDEGSGLCLVTEWCERGSLFDMLYDYSIVIDTRQMFEIALDIARGMNFLHSITPAIVHRDLKSQNILIGNDGSAKIADFGLSLTHNKKGSDGERYGVFGTPEWIAPEVMLGNNYNESVDVYSFGILLTEIFARSMPYVDLLKDTNYQAVAEYVIICEKMPTVPSWCSLFIFPLIKQCLSHDPSCRPTFGYLCQYLEELLENSDADLLLSYDLKRIRDLLHDQRMEMQALAAREITHLAKHKRIYINLDLCQAPTPQILPPIKLYNDHKSNYIMDVSSLFSASKKFTPLNEYSLRKRQSFQHRPQHQFNNGIFMNVHAFNHLNTLLSTFYVPSTHSLLRNIEYQFGAIAHSEYRYCVYDEHHNEVYTPQQSLLAGVFASSPLIPANAEFFHSKVAKNAAVLHQRREDQALAGGCGSPYHGADDDSLLSPVFTQLQSMLSLPPAEQQMKVELLRYSNAIYPCCCALHTDQLSTLETMRMNSIYTHGCSSLYGYHAKYLKRDASSLPVPATGGVNDNTSPSTSGSKQGQSYSSLSSASSSMSSTAFGSSLSNGLQQHMGAAPGLEDTLGHNEIYMPSWFTLHDITTDVGTAVDQVWEQMRYVALYKSQQPFYSIYTAMESAQFINRMLRNQFSTNYDNHGYVPTLRYSANEFCYQQRQYHHQFNIIANSNPLNQFSRQNFIYNYGLSTPQQQQQQQQKQQQQEQNRKGGANGFHQIQQSSPYYTLFNQNTSINSVRVPDDMALNLASKLASLLSTCLVPETTHENELCYLTWIFSLLEALHSMIQISDDTPQHIPRDRTDRMCYRLCQSCKSSDHLEFNQVPCHTQHKSSSANGHFATTSSPSSSFYTNNSHDHQLPTLASRISISLMNNPTSRANGNSICSTIQAHDENTFQSRAKAHSLVTGNPYHFPSRLALHNTDAYQSSSTSPTSLQGDATTSSSHDFSTLSSRRYLCEQITRDGGFYSALTFFNLELKDRDSVIRRLGDVAERRRGLMTVPPSGDFIADFTSKKSLFETFCEFDILSNALILYQSTSELADSLLSILLAAIPLSLLPTLAYGVPTDIITKLIRKSEREFGEIHLVMDKLALNAKRIGFQERIFRYFLDFNQGSASDMPIADIQPTKYIAVGVIDSSNQLTNLMQDNLSSPMNSYNLSQSTSRGSAFPHSLSSHPACVMEVDESSDALYPSTSTATFHTATEAYQRHVQNDGITPTAHMGTTSGAAVVSPRSGHDVGDSHRYDHQHTSHTNHDYNHVNQPHQPHPHQHHHEYGADDRYVASYSPTPHDDDHQSSNTLVSSISSPATGTGYKAVMGSYYHDHDQLPPLSPSSEYHDQTQTHGSLHPPQSPPSQQQHHHQQQQQQQQPHPSPSPHPPLVGDHPSSSIGGNPPPTALPPTPARPLDHPQRPLPSIPLTTTPPLATSPVSPTPMVQLPQITQPKQSVFVPTLSLAHGTLSPVASSHTPRVASAETQNDSTRGLQASAATSPTTAIASPPTPTPYKRVPPPPPPRPSVLEQTRIFNQIATSSSFSKKDLNLTSSSSHSRKLSDDGVIPQGTVATVMARFETIDTTPSITPPSK